MTVPHDSPSAAALLEAVRQFLEREVIEATEGRIQFHTRVAVNVLGVVGRELDRGTEQALHHAEGLVTLGFEDDASLAAAIRAGAVDDRIGAVAAFVRQAVESKLAVANPSYVQVSSGHTGSQEPL